MNPIRWCIGFTCLLTILTTSTRAAGQSDEERLISRLAGVSKQIEQRADAFMRELRPRQAALRLDDLSTPENLASAEGRAAIRRGFLSFARLLDDIESFERAEEIKVERALAEATSDFLPGMALEAQRAFKRGYARTTARHAALRDTQRKSIRATMELVDLIDRAPAGATFAKGRLSFSDRETGMQVSRLLSELSRLETEEQRLEQETQRRWSVPVEPKLR